MHERDHATRQSPDGAPAPRGRGAQPTAAALNRAVGNRAMGRMLARMEASEAVEPLEKALATGVFGADRVVADTLGHFAGDPVGFDKVAIEFEKKTEQPLLPAVNRLGGEGAAKAQAATPRGFFPGISGEKYPGEDA